MLAFMRSTDADTCLRAADTVRVPKCSRQNVAPHYLPLLFQFARAHSQQPERDRCFIALSYYAALRAQEIAFMELRDVTDAAGALSDYIEVSARAAKYGNRAVPAIGSSRTH